MAKLGLILGVAGQDGAYLAELLLSKGYEVAGVCRQGPSRSGTYRLESLGILKNISLFQFDASDNTALERCIRTTEPDEIYNLAGISSVARSFLDPALVVNGNTEITRNCLEIIRKTCPSVRYYNAASSECFGDTGESAATEATGFAPVSPYAAAKASDYFLTQVYRRAFGLFCSSGILFNHESPLRGEAFVTKKIILGASEIAAGRRDFVELGNMDIQRDWGWAPEYVEAIYRIVQHDEPDDFVVASGTTTSLAKFVEIVFSRLGLNWQNHVRINPDLIRAGEIQKSWGQPEKARKKLGWSATYTVDDIISEMIGNLANR